MADKTISARMKRYRERNKWVRVEVQVPASGREKIKALAAKLRKESA